MESGLYKKYIGSPNKQNGIDPKKKKAYQDSVQNLHKASHDSYLVKQAQGYNTSDDDGQTFNFVPPQKDLSKIKNLKEYAYAMEIGKGGTVVKNGKTASQLARKYK